MFNFSKDIITNDEVADELEELVKLSPRELAKKFIGISAAVSALALENGKDPIQLLEVAHEVVKDKLKKIFDELFDSKINTKSDSDSKITN